MTRILGKAGYEVHDLASAENLDATIQEFLPDLVVCDVMMPGRNGLSVCKALHADPRTRSIQVILASSRSFESDKKAALDAGAAAYLVKPFKPADLVRVASEALNTNIEIRAWGCRGSITAPEWASGRYGANTTCLDVFLPGHGHLVFDAGSGIRTLGNKLVGQSPLRIAILLTHYHWDHIQGLPFFKPLYVPGNDFTIYGPADSNDELVDLIRGQMGGAFFPVSVEAFRAAIRWIALREQKLEVMGAQVSTLYAFHPSTTLAYRVDFGDRSIVFAPDNELLPEFVEPKLGDQALRFAEFAKGATLLLHDCQYSTSGYETHRGWGHSGSKYVAAVAAHAGVKRVLLFHHDPDHSDEQIDTVHEEFRTALKDYDVKVESAAAQEGVTYTL